MQSLLLRSALVLGTAAGLACLPGLSQAVHATVSMQSGGINPGILRFCENQRNDSWASRHAPRDETFFHQELALGEGSYTLRVSSGGRYRFDVYVYDRDTNRYLGGAKNVASHSQRLSAGKFDRAFLVQAVKTTANCRGCSISMSLDANNCPQRTPAPAKKPCRVNQCYDPGAQDLYGLPLRPPRCVSKPGANGGVCGSLGN